MNDWDRDNLMFLLNCSWSEFEEFAESLYDLDELQYAIQLIQRGLSEMAVEEMNETDDVQDVSEADKVIKSIMGKK